MIKGYAWHFNFIFWLLDYRCTVTVTQNVLQWDLMRSTVGRSAMGDLSEYVLVVADCI